MTITEKLKNSILVFDGAMGTRLQSAGLPVGTQPEEWNLTNPEAVRGVHKSYLDAGADVILTNTFGANPFKFGDRTGEIVRTAVSLARQSVYGRAEKYVALDLGPTGKLLKPLGELDFEQAVECYKQVVRAAQGVDLVFIETMNDIYEAKAAVIAVKECGNLPVFVSCVFGEDGKTMTGASPEAAVALFEGLGVSALGVNCSLAPKQMRGVVERLLKCSSTPVIVKPNAGLPQLIDGETVYDLSAKEFCDDLIHLVKLGARCVGGCCGTSPEYISRLSAGVRRIVPSPVTDKKLTVVSSYTHPVYFGGEPVLIGERINPTGKKRLKQAISEGDIGYILNEAVTQSERGVHALDVNVGLPEIDEAAVLTRVISEIQAVTDLPLQIDTSDPVAMESAMRIYNGKPLVNSVNGKKECMRAVFPLVKKYGGTVIALTLDEDGIPADADGRIKIAKRILETAKEYGIDKKDIIFDTLAMSVSADGGAAVACLRSLEYIKRVLGANTSLGVSNISFGLPQRDFINSAFFSMALQAGLSAAIMNPFSEEMTKAYKCYMALCGRDKNCLSYIDYASGFQAVEFHKTEQKSDTAKDGDLKYCIIKGLKSEAAEKAKRLLERLAPLEVIDGYIIPALDETGADFENKKVYLPQLLMSAEAASAAFEVIKTSFKGEAKPKKLKIVLATVKGDVHDIGKNIVKTLL
ncbi:MAG: homocysteine S-methyltransferase family protein [Clostridia bacterium]|nr:homocysteine S-methyltransferase family protein [Clostridia bacterium]